MVNLKHMRQRAGFTLEDTARITGIHANVLSQFETGHRRPNAAHMLALSRLFPDLADADGWLGVPPMPEPRFTREGEPDFSHLETNHLSHDELREKVEGLLGATAAIDRSRGESVSLVDVLEDEVIYAVNLAGGCKLYRQGIKTGEDRKVTLSGDPVGMSVRTAWVDNSGTRTIYLLQDALREKFPGKGLIVVEHDDATVTFVTPVGGLYRLGYTISGKQITLSHEPPEPVNKMRRVLNESIRWAKIMAGQGVPNL